jgi:hypothetical protein
MAAAAEIPKNITPRIAVLGLLVQQPDTISGVSRRLREQFPTAYFPESSAYNNVKSLTQAGFLRLADRSSGLPPRSYVATTAGNKFSQKWVLSSSLPPVMRDPLQGKLAFVDRDHIVALIRLVREEERAFTLDYDRVQSRSFAHKRFRNELTEPEWSIEVHAIRLKDEVALSGVMVLRRKKVRKELEELLRRLPKD